MELAPVLDEEESARLYRLIAETIPHIVWTARADGSLDFFNRRCYEYTGLDASSLSGWAWRSLVHPDDSERTLSSWARALQSGERFEIEYRLRRADGVYRWHQGAAVPLRDAGGRVARWFGTCTDIELQIQSARILESMVADRTRALREAEQRLGAIIETEPECVKLLDAQGHLLDMNRAGLQMIEAGGLGEVAGCSVYEFIAEEHREAFRRLTERVCRGERGTLEFELIGLRGTRRWLETHAVPFVDESSGATRLLAVTRDVTERKRVERALRENESRTRALVGRLIAARESERRQLADELHDLIGQNLTALGIDLMALKPRLPTQDVAGAARLEAMRSLVERTIDSIRGVMTGLRPPALEEFGLVPALRAHAADFAERTRIKVALAVSGEGRPPYEIELALFRVVQEALTNAAKHSGAAAVRIEIETLPERVRVSVADDGRGFAEMQGARGARGGWGVPEMRERAEAHGGTLRIASSAQGTRLTVEIPATAPA